MSKRRNAHRAIDLHVFTWGSAIVVMEAVDAHGWAKLALGVLGVGSWLWSWKWAIDIDTERNVRV